MDDQSQGMHLKQFFHWLAQNKVGAEVHIMWAISLLLLSNTFPCVRWFFFHYCISLFTIQVLQTESIFACRGITNNPFYIEVNHSLIHYNFYSPFPPPHIQVALIHHGGFQV